MHGPNQQQLAQQLVVLRQAINALYSGQHNDRCGHCSGAGQRVHCIPGLLQSRYPRMWKDTAQSAQGVDATGPEATWWSWMCEQITARLVVCADWCAAS